MLTLAAAILSAPALCSDPAGRSLLQSREMQQPRQEASAIKSDERVILFPALAHKGEDGIWSAEVHGWIFEPEHDSAWRKELIEALGIRTPADTDDEARGIFDERARAFIVDNERGKSVALRIGDRRFVSQPSAPNGHFLAVVRFSDEEAQAAAMDPPVPGTALVRVDLPVGDGRRFAGRVHLIAADGLSVVCDIDDTVRITGVDDPESLIDTTFFKPFTPVPEVRVLCADLTARGATFHYVSSSPWQLYEPLESFMHGASFPAGSFHLKTFRLKDSTFLSLFEMPESFKTPVIEELMQRWPRRRFVFIGDAGEKDPEIYGDLVRRFPERIEHIYVRDMRGEGRESERMRSAFRDVPAEKWSLVGTGSAPKPREKP